MTRRLIFGCLATFYFISCAQGLDELQVSGESKVKSDDAKKSSIKDIETDESKKRLKKQKLKNYTPLIRDRNRLESYSFGQVVNYGENYGFIFSAGEVEVYKNDEKTETFPAFRMEIKFVATKSTLKFTLPICGRQTSLENASCVTDQWINSRTAKYVYVSPERVLYEAVDSSDDSPLNVDAEVTAVDDSHEKYRSLSLLIKGKGNLSRGTIRCQKATHTEEDGVVACPSSLGVGKVFKAKSIGVDQSFEDAAKILKVWGDA